MEKKTNMTIPIISAALIIVVAAAYMLFKLGQKSICDEKWKDYDDYGWS